MVAMSRTRELGPPALALGAVWLVLTFLPPLNGGISDVPVYFAYGHTMVDGALPYRDFEPEYPPLALLLFWLPALLESSDVTTYGDLFALLLLPFAWAGQLATALLAPAGWPRRLAAWAPVALLPLFATLATERFDIAPAALCAVALALLVHGRPRSAFAVLGVGGALKLFPLLLVPIAGAWLLARSGPRVAGACAAIAVAVAVLICAPFMVASPDGFAEQFRFHLDRPVQIESSPASVLLALGDPRVTGLTAEDNEFRSQGLDGTGEGTATAVFTLLLALSVAAFTALSYRAVTSVDGLLLASLGALTAFVALGKVLSPQFLLWLAPLVIAVGVRGRVAIAAAGGAAIYLTTALFPDHYGEMLRVETGTALAYGLRNVLLLAVLVSCLRALAAPARSRAPAVAPAPSR